MIGAARTGEQLKRALFMMSNRALDRTEGELITGVPNCELGAGVSLSLLLVLLLLLLMLLMLLLWLLVLMILFTSLF